MPTRKSLFDLSISLRALAGAAFRRLSRGHDDSVELFVTIVDHFEPSHGKATREAATARLDDWISSYPGVAQKHRDSEGRIPKHSFFYPWDEYDEVEFRALAQFCSEGFGEIELHLHHRDDTSDSLRSKLRDAVAAYRSHGALSEWKNGKPAFGFIHGDWALDNSRYEDGRNFCGVNDELSILQQEGCYADFTFPAWQQPAQPVKLNSLYYAIDDPLRPKSHNSGIDSTVGHSEQDGLLIIQGPLVPHWETRFSKPRPAMDDGDLASSPGRRYAPERLDRWVSAGVHVRGNRARVFVKLHCHLAPDHNRIPWLHQDLHALFSDLEARYNDGQKFRLHYLTAREMFNVIRATEDRVSEIGPARDWILPPPCGTAARVTT